MAISVTTASPEQAAPAGSMAATAAIRQFLEAQPGKQEGEEKALAADRQQPIIITAMLSAAEAEVSGPAAALDGTATELEVQPTGKRHSFLSWEVQAVVADLRAGHTMERAAAVAAELF